MLRKVRCHVVTQAVLYLCRNEARHEACRRDAERNGWGSACITGSALAAQAFLRRAGTELPPLVFLVPSEDADRDVEWWGEFIKREVRTRRAFVTVVTP